MIHRYRRVGKKEGTITVPSEGPVKGDGKKAGGSRWFSKSERHPKYKGEPEKHGGGRGSSIYRKWGGK